MTQFGERLAALRKQRDMSQEALAEKLGLTRQTISKWETGASTPDLGLLVRLAEVFGVSTDSLLGVETVASQEKESKGSAEILFYVILLIFFAAGVGLYFYESWLLVNYGTFSPPIECASLAMIFLPPSLIVGRVIVRYRARRREAKEQKRSA